MRLVDVKDHGCDPGHGPRLRSGRLVWRPWYWPFVERNALVWWRRGIHVDEVKVSGQADLSRVRAAIEEWHKDELRRRRAMEDEAEAARIREMRGELVTVTLDVPPVEF